MNEHVTTPEFLDMVNPQITFVQDNDYPADEAEPKSVYAIDDFDDEDEDEDNLFLDADEDEVLTFGEALSTPKFH